MTVIDDFGDYLGNAAQTVVEMIFYPISLFFAMIYGWFDLILASFVDLFTAFWNLITLFYDFFVQILALFPGTWGTIYLTLFLTVAVLRLYYFVKGVQIMGFSI